MKPKVPIKVEFWLEGEKLFVKNEKTGELIITEDSRQIAFFLNAHHLTIHDVEGQMNGYDVYGWFYQKQIREPFKFIEL